MLVTYQVEVNIKEVWENMMGGHSGYWADNFETLDSGIVRWYLDEDYENPNVQDFKVLAEDKWHTVTVQALAEAYVKLKQDSWTHCRGCSIDENDACTGDAILQVATFGELIYG